MLWIRSGSIQFRPGYYFEGFSDGLDPAVVGSFSLAFKIDLIGFSGVISGHFGTLLEDSTAAFFKKYQFDIISAVSGSVLQDLSVNFHIIDSSTSAGLF